MHRPPTRARGACDKTTARRCYFVVAVGAVYRAGDDRKTDRFHIGYWRDLLSRSFVGINEGTGTTLNDEIGTWDLTITGADWGADGTHGDKLTFVASKNDYLLVTGIGSMSDTVMTWCGIFQITTGDPSSDQTLFGFGDSFAETNVQNRVLNSNGQLLRYATLSGSASSGGGVYDLVAASAWQVVCDRATDSAAPLFATTRCATPTT